MCIERLKMRPCLQKKFCSVHFFAHLNLRLLCYGKLHAPHVEGRITIDIFHIDVNVWARQKVLQYFVVGVTSSGM